MNTRKLIIYAGLILLSVTTILAIVANNGTFKAQVALEEPCVAEVDVNGDGLVNTDDCTGTGSENEVVPCDEVTTDTTAAITTPIKCEPPVCAEGNPPTDVPGSVKQSRDAADNTAAGTGADLEPVKAATKSDIENGSTASDVKAVSKVVYNTEAEAKQALQKKWETSIVPRLKIEYYEAGWSKVNARTSTSGTQAKGFFGTRYSKDPDRWGPQVTGQYTFLRNGNADITGRVVIGGFTYNGQSLDSGFANISATGTWNIFGDTLQGVASYSCEIGTASGSTNVDGKWTNIGFRANIPAWIKSGKGAYKVTFQFGINLVEKRVTFPFGLGWNF